MNDLRPGYLQTFDVPCAECGKTIRRREKDRRAVCFTCVAEKKRNYNKKEAGEGL